MLPYSGVFSSPCLHSLTYTVSTYSLHIHHLAKVYTYSVYIQSTHTPSRQSLQHHLAKVRRGVFLPTGYILHPHPALSMSTTMSSPPSSSPLHGESSTRLGQAASQYQSPEWTGLRDAISSRALVGRLHEQRITCFFFSGRLLQGYTEMSDDGRQSKTARRSTRADVAVGCPRTRSCGYRGADDWRASEHKLPFGEGPSNPLQTGVLNTVTSRFDGRR